MRPTLNDPMRHSSNAHLLPNFTMTAEGLCRPGGKSLPRCMLNTRLCNLAMLPGEFARREPGHAPERPGQVTLIAEAQRRRDLAHRPVVL